jgi:glycosyltransferase involved in cell wall biosynthesis
MGGADKRLWELARKLAENGEHDVHIYGMKWWHGPDTIVTENVHLHGVCKVRELYNDRGIRSIKEALIYALKVLPPLLRADYDVIDCNQFPYFPCFSGKIASIIKKRPLVITWLEVWGAYWSEYLGAICGSFGKVVERLTMRLPDGVVAISQKTKSDLIRRKVKPQLIDVIPVGIDLERISNIAPAMNATDVLFAGRLIREKRVDVLLKALAIVKTNAPTISCVIIGDGPERRSLQGLTAKLGLNDNVDFMGFVDQDGLTAQMKSSKVLVLPSVREGFGLVIVEANACKLPVISISHEMSAVRELIENGVNGFLISNISPDQIAEAVLKIVLDDELRNKLAENGLKISKKYAWSDISKNIIDTYEKLIAD